MAPELTHSSLESLLLFQAVQEYKEKPPAFGKISDILKANTLLQESDSFLENRLEPESLERNYLQLLKEEAKLESQRDYGIPNGGQSPRKRKRSSPLLETTEEGLQYTHLLPQLTNRLYFCYRDEAIKAIDDEERKYRSLQAEIKEIERGERDARIRLEDASRRDTRGVSSIQTLLRHDDESEIVGSSVRAGRASSQDRPNGLDSGARVGTSQTLPNRPAQGIQTPEPGTRLGDRNQIQPPRVAEQNVNYLPPLQHVNHGFSMESPNSDAHRRLPPPPQLPSHPPPSPSPRSAQTTMLPERTSASPIILPPMLSNSGSPTGPLDALADMAGQQYRASPSGPSPRTVQQQAAPQHPHQLSQGRYYMPRPYPHAESQAPYQAPYSPYGQGPLPPANYHYQGAMPPYQGHLGTTAHSSPYGNMPPYQAPVAPYTQHPGYNQTHGYYQQPPIQTPYPRGPVSRFHDQYTPVSSTASRQRPSKPTPITTSASSTRWKNVDVANTVRQPSPRSPSPGAVSPISEKALSPPREVSQPRTRNSRIAKVPVTAVDSPSETVRGKASRGRGNARRYRGGRTASAESSAHADSSLTRTRSQSIASQVDELSIDQRASTRKIKPEPSGTSMHEDDASVASSTVDEGARKINKQRRGTNMKPGTAESNVISTKRTREDSAIHPPPSPASILFSRPGFVLGTRNLPRTSTTLLNDILAHKVGSLFSKPITDTQAPGYHSQIYRPQDIKSIKAAIVAGGKALLKAAEQIGESGNASNVWVPESEDVVPPKGIVNSAQLEKELMRMFANAIMFNKEIPSRRGFGPAFRTRKRTLERGAMHSEDDDEFEDEVTKGKQDVSVVKDAREIFEAAEKKVAEWRAAEEGGASKTTVGRLRGGGSEEIDELAGDGDHVFGSVEQDATPEPRAKRRKK